MVFSSIIFILYFLPTFLLTYYFADKKYKNFVILFFSIFFYSWGAPKFIFVILGTTFIDYYLVRWMDSTERPLYRRLMLTLSISINLGLLFYFKYSNFFVENANELLSHFGLEAVHWTKLILPIGISFYTFETITYVVDVYRKVHKPLTNFWDYQLYIILFPKLIAGPIVRYHEIADQLTDRSQNDTADEKLMGFYRFAIGLAKKVLIANQMGLQADAIFDSDYGNLSSSVAWIGILAYTFQIYFDFAGYSDMAIGIARMVGFKFPENFNNPYVSQSVTEFWRRWHITLGNWMRNYLYIPLGGNRVEKWRLYFNLWLVFLASGFWHGASWNFIIWGAYHGLFLVLERVFLLKIYARIGPFFSTLFTFFVVTIGWVFFRVEKFSDAINYLKQLFSFHTNAEIQIKPDGQFYTFFSIAIFFSFFTYLRKGQKMHDVIYFEKYTNGRYVSMAVICALLVLLSVSFIATVDFNPFIYFRF
ncbi:MAG: putative rane protein involved in D-alanine export [Chitinophagaceae bacterium]|nr:putative rane protein involved in D-alanine export [Chitinophagaceae bacterium]